MNKLINERCPLADECERKKCEYNRHELDCIYYSTNAREDYCIPDQEEIRNSQERARLEEQWLRETQNEDPLSRENWKMTDLEYIPVTLLRPHPDNPRKDIGDVSELAESIKANGIFQNLTVIPSEDDDDTYTVIIGHRRLAAAMAAGLTAVPCIVTDMTRKEQLSTMLLENMQRSDLTVYEQAQGFQMMLDLGETIESIAKQSGFSTTTVRRRVKMAELDQDTLKKVSERQLSLSDFDQLAQIDNLDKRNEVLATIGTRDFGFTFQRELRKQNTEKNIPVVKKLLRDVHAQGIKKTDTWGCDYDLVGSRIMLYEWDGKSPILPKKSPKPLYYYLDKDCGELRFYEKHKRAAPKRKTDTEIKHEQALKAIWAKGDELDSLTYELRSSFVRGLSLNVRNVTTMLKGAVASSILRSINYESSDKALCFSTLGIDDSGYDPQRGEKAMCALENISAKAYPMLIYSNFGDGKETSYIGGYKSTWPEYKPNAKLDALYRWLCSLGYEMSTEEKALQDGSHELFSRGKMCED